MLAIENRTIKAGTSVNAGVIAQMAAESSHWRGGQPSEQSNSTRRRLLMLSALLWCAQSGRVELGRPRQLGRPPSWTRSPGRLSGTRHARQHDASSLPSAVLTLDAPRHLARRVTRRQQTGFDLCLQLSGRRQSGSSPFNQISFLVQPLSRESRLHLPGSLTAGS